MYKPIVFIDMDGVVADFDKAYPEVAQPTWEEGSEKKVPEGFYRNLELVEGAVEALHELDRLGYDLYFLSTAQWSNPSCWMEKREWVEEYFGELMFKRLILTHNKGLLRGEYLIDDRIKNGVENFQGKHIHFGSEQFPNWQRVVAYLTTESTKYIYKEPHPHYNIFV